MEKLYNCENGHTVYITESPTKGMLIGVWDETGTPVVYVVQKKDEHDKAYLLELIEGFGCWVCNPPPELSKRLIKYISTETPEEKAARTTRKSILDAEVE